MDVDNRGIHLIIDGKAEPELLRNKSLIKDIFTCIVLQTGMNVLDCKMYEIPEDEETLLSEKFKDSGGVTGYVVLTTSHICIHTFPLKSEFKLDIFSCKPYNTVPIIDIITNNFNITKEHITISELRR